MTDYYARQAQRGLDTMLLACKVAIVVLCLYALAYAGQQP